MHLTEWPEAGSLPVLTRGQRIFGALLLVRGSRLLPLYEDMDSYFWHGHQGEAHFAAASTWIKPSMVWAVPGGRNVRLNPEMTPALIEL